MASNLLLAAIVAGFAFFFHVSRVLDYGNVIYNHRPGVCRRISGPVNGSEDIEVVKSEGIAFITSGLIFMTPERAHVRGKIFLYDLNQNPGAGQLSAVDLPISGNFDHTNFHPHGLTHWVVNGVIRLYVINHDNDFKHSVMIFDFNPSGPSLVFKESITHKALIRPNDIVAVGPDQIIYTNDGTAQTLLYNALEMFSGVRTGSVYYSDLKTFTPIIEKKGSPNGIAYDDARNKLFVSIVNSEEIEAYELAKDKRSATFLSTTPTYSTCDNLSVDGDGEVFSGCHPIMHESAKTMGDPDNHAIFAPSHVLRLKYSEDYTKPAFVSEPYANDGREITGASSAVVFNNQMLIGSVFRNLIHCEIADRSVL